MRNIILTLIFSIPFFLKSQTLLEYDRMETSSTLYVTAGWWTPALTTGWYTNASVSPTQSAVIYGSGTSTSSNEQDWYSIPNKIGLDVTKQYQLRFRLASYIFTSSTATTRGNDIADFVEVQVSRNGGSYVSELRITGNSNATWPFTSTGIINHTANGSFTNSATPTGDVYQSPAGSSTTGPSTINLTLPYGTSQVAVDIFCRVNAAGEEWWIDNIELWDITPVSLPVELIYFEGKKYSTYNLLQWSTASESNSDYFQIEESNGDSVWNSVGLKSASGNSNTKIDYSYSVLINDNIIHYYRLKQFDIDGKYKIYGIISIDNTLESKKIIKYINIMGQEIDPNTKGMFFEVYEDGTTKKIIR